MNVKMKNQKKYITIDEMNYGDTFICVNSPDVVYMIADKLARDHTRVVNLVSGEIRYPSSFKYDSLVRVNCTLEYEVC